ncbi:MULTISPECIES: hypothetical protein [unclassified Burkholderia]|uniref:hypothetical protein n=1 Tax=unclassified Burkholderia TaxID=2613784 RepID=UPI000756FDD6|nr:MULTISPECIES: hypothetical protein [unclassified Burkholderia]AOI80637.1 hypothetical protein WS54_30210 [Burkholderia sp. NRF60-BP8]KVA10476.1 hypothetical protein WS54_17670 [Burkholderia sp. NRF60-BP8]KVL10898.1 hypothetical protein WS95_04425 [Burkholderia sp. MSMB1826]KWE60598.1 hypothetical protein WT53_09600 [Burkholderia sp. MSMB2157WGS]
MMFRHSPGPHAAAEPDTDERSSSGIPGTLPDSGVVVNVRGVAHVIRLPPRDHARPALWRALADWRDERSADGDVEPAPRRD